jgi:hypothetical protein
MVNHSKIKIPKGKNLILRPEILIFIQTNCNSSDINYQTYPC